MAAFPSRRQFVSVCLLSLLEITAAGCGTILHPERRGQAAGRLDWGVVALDAVGLLFFFIPGVIAFAVDFSNGTIYLPADHSAGSPAVGASQTETDQLLSFATPHQQLTPTTIEQTVARQTGREIRLVPGAYQTKELDRLDQFWKTRAEFEVG